jgi:ABC-type antimicrobial peptide transport system permease subunit
MGGHLEKELRFHVDQRADDMIARGCTPDEARRQALLSLGGLEQVKETYRDARGTRWLEDVVQDTRHAFRTFRQKPGVRPLQFELRGAARDQALYEVRTMEQLVGASLARHRFLLFLFGIFGGIALILASTGVYGVLAYLTGQRVPEIGMRMALGATVRDVMTLVLRQCLRMAPVGIGLGIVAALAAGHALQRLVQGMQPVQVATFAIMVTLLLAAAVVAGLVPALRASRVDPVTALRQE